MKKLFIGLALVGTGIAVYALTKGNHDNHLNLSAKDIPAPVKRKIKESASASAHALNASGEKMDDILVHIAKLIGKDEERIQELIGKIGSMSEAKKKELLKLTGKLNRKLA
jgi:hypothetical protein